MLEETPILQFKRFHECPCGPLSDFDRIHLIPQTLTINNPGLMFLTTQKRSNAKETAKTGASVDQARGDGEEENVEPHGAEKDDDCFSLTALCIETCRNDAAFNEAR